MSSLAETINNALRAVGPMTEDKLRDVMAEFDTMNLSAEERLAAVATTVAAAAATHHRRHKSVYLDAVRTWALEIASELQPSPLRLRTAPDRGQIEDGAEILIAGIDALIETMTAEAVATQDRLVTELALVTRLLGQNDANTIHLTLLAVARALESGDYRPGNLVATPLRETAMPLSRQASLETLAPRGCA
jgi:hypothetical protein